MGRLKRSDVKFRVDMLNSMIARRGIQRTIVLGMRNGYYAIDEYHSDMSSMVGTIRAGLTLRESDNIIKGMIHALVWWVE